MSKLLASRAILQLAKSVSIPGRMQERVSVERRLFASTGVQAQQMLEE